MAHATMGQIDPQHLCVGGDTPAEAEGLRIFAGPRLDPFFIDLAGVLAADATQKLRLAALETGPSPVACSAPEKVRTASGASPRAEVVHYLSRRGTRLDDPQAGAVLAAVPGGASSASLFLLPGPLASQHRWCRPTRVPDGTSARASFVRHSAKTNGAPFPTAQPPPRRKHRSRAVMRFHLFPRRKTGRADQRNRRKAGQRPFSAGSRIATYSTWYVIGKTCQHAETGYLQVSVVSGGALNGSSGPGASDERKPRWRYSIDEAGPR